MEPCVSTAHLHSSDTRAGDAVRAVFALPEPHATRAAGLPGLRAEIEALPDKDVSAMLRGILAETSTRSSMNGTAHVSVGVGSVRR